MKKIFSFALALLMLASVLALSACELKLANAPEGTITRITVDINPSIEFMVDDQNKVVSVTALNDDGSVLLVGEAIVGMQAEEAVEYVVSLATEMGYIVKGNVSADENEIKISVSGDSEYAKKLLEKAENKINDFMEKHDINGKVEKTEAAKIDALREIALSTSLYTEEEIAVMTEEQLYAVIKAGRIETALLVTKEMREAYYRAKEHKISFAEREETAKVIESMGGLYIFAYAGYKTALDTYAKTITAIDEFRYSALIDPESAYQKSLAELREKKEIYLYQKNYAANFEIGSEEYELAIATLKITEEEYDKALAAYEKLGEEVNAALEKLVEAMREGEKTLIKLEENFSSNIKAELAAKAVETEEKLNAAKTEFFAEFEAAHNNDIEAIEADLIARKEALKAFVKTY